MSNFEESTSNDPTYPVLAGQNPESAPVVQQEQQQPKANRKANGVYKPGGFHPVYIGDIYNGKYTVLSKLGYGLYSTVWLVRDTSSPEEAKYYALKVLSADCYGTEKDIFEREILRHLRDADRNHVGYRYICHLVDDFEHSGPNGTHLLLVLELMGEKLTTFGTLFNRTMVPNPLMRRFTFYLLAGLDYAHDSNVIHTDIKPDNIFVNFMDTSLIESEYLKQLPSVVQDRLADTYSPVPSQSLKMFYFKLGQSLLDFEVALGDWGVSSWADNHLSELIQPVTLRAPEVLIQAPWDATTDWWNLGAVLLEVFRCVRMFDGRGPPDGHYDLRQHLHEIVTYFGPFPKALLEKGDAELVQTYFDEAGYVKGAPPLELPSLESDDYMDDLDAENRKLFVSFLRAIMRIDPQERLSTMDLLRQPWLGLNFG
ncbi:kinase-like protein [Cryphonectria parasitica EP155]|uniref:non-specific serine/threonine protein kinase n=1 Tax=Cryphonectria parasitica (strain ATCC 38755 / EP155) TaxID=660469 RepID=A0A9P4Y9U3_CRYP1|nr:kinase-like protein [Cryphonectria parasitica EP155]KAF3769136.1 kinase-like protein [Cryphonectria parasitica EP155]